MTSEVEHWLSMPDIVDKLRCPVIHQHLTLYHLNIDETLPVMAEAASEIERLRAAVLAEREACARLCLLMASKWRETGMMLHEQRAIGQEHAAAAIRARSNELHDKPDF